MYALRAIAAAISCAGPGRTRDMARSGTRSLRLLAVPFFPECVARVPVSLGGLGVRLCSPSFAFAVATVGKCPQPFAVPP